MAGEGLKTVLLASPRGFSAGVVRFVPPVVS